MVRVLFILFLLTGTALASPGHASWKAEYWGENPAASQLPEKDADRNGVTVIAAATASYVDAYLTTAIDVSDQEESNDDESTAWFRLKFVGSPNATEHHWRIHTDIVGTGQAEAYSCFEASSWGESLQVVTITGDNENLGGGHLAVRANAKAGLSIVIPKSLKSIFTKSSRARALDKFTASFPKDSFGQGKSCAIQVDNSVEASGAACSVIQTSSFWIRAQIDAEIEMVGFCRFAGINVKDRFRLLSDDDDETKAAVTPPSGGIEAGEDEPPTIESSPEAGEDDDEEEAADEYNDTGDIDAKDLWKLLPNEPEDTPAVQPETSVEEE